MTIEDKVKNTSLIQIQRLKDIANNAKNKFKTTKDEKGVVIDKYVGSEETILIPSTIEGEKVYRIGDSSFANCYHVKKVILPNGVTEIGNRAFYASGIESIELQEGLSIIGDIAFKCSKIKNIVLPQSLMSIGWGCFSYTPLKEIIIPENVKEIPDQAFESSALETVVIEGAVLIGKSAFSSTWLKNIILPNGLKVIETNAFSCGCRMKVDNYGKIMNDCYRLVEWKKIIIPETVLEIGKNNFRREQHVAILNENVQIDFTDSWSKNGGRSPNLNKYATIYCNNTGNVWANARNQGVNVKLLGEFLYDEALEKTKEFENNPMSHDAGSESSELDTSSWNLESVLKREGYTASQKENLTDYERQQILLSVIQQKLMSKQQIIEHIELQISLRQNNRMYSTAISKWERDLAFLRKL